jgi:uncharacterized membrane protein YdcZ (DUF606 family)
MSHWIISFFLGFLAVLQAGLNREITKVWGLSSAVLINSSVLLVFTISFFWLSLRHPQIFPPSFAAKVNFSTWKWWFIIPAICGFCIISGIPALIPRMGATSVFLSLVVSQMTFSLVWDLCVEHMSFEPRRLVGVALALTGLFIASWKS